MSLSCLYPIFKKNGVLLCSCQILVSYLHPCFLDFNPSRCMIFDGINEKSTSFLAHFLAPCGIELLLLPQSIYVLQKFCEAPSDGHYFRKRVNIFVNLYPTQVIMAFVLNENGK